MRETPSVEVLTFGCRLNARESDVMGALAAAGGLRDVAIVNTCAVTAEAERQARQAIRRLRRERPAATIVVTGCAAQIDPQRYGAMPEATHVLGNAEKLQAGTWRDLATAPRVQVSALRDAAVPAAPQGEENVWPHPEEPAASAGVSKDEAPRRTRAYLDVQQGCDHRCTFCIIPYGRGPSRSLPSADAVARVRILVGAGAREVVLTGVDLTAWGDDLPERPRLGALVEDILAGVPELPRLRLSSLDPAEIDDRLIELIGSEKRVMPHLHLSLQSGDDLILKRMKRRHSTAQARAVIARVRARRDVALGADLIAGFPTEDEARFGRSLAFVSEALDFVHVFPFSARSGTPAARMRQLPGSVVRERAAALRDAAKAAQARFLARQIGRTFSVLVERSGRSGHAENFALVTLDHQALPGTIVEVMIDRVAGDRVLGRVLEARPA